MAEKKESIFKHFVSQLKPAQKGCCDVKIEENFQEQISSSKQNSSTQG